MTTPSSSYRPRGSLFRPAGPGPDMRVSDSDRTEIADQLSKHYSDGRLDETEFHQRLDRAMSAKTQSDLNGLLADLPGSQPPPRGRARPQRQRGSLGRILLLALFVVIAAAVGQALLHMYLLWILIALAVFIWFRYSNRHHR